MLRHVVKSPNAPFVEVIPVHAVKMSLGTDLQINGAGGSKQVAGRTIGKREGLDLSKKVREKIAADITCGKVPLGRVVEDTGSDGG